MRRIVTRAEVVLSEWLQDPAVQSGIVPFAAGLIAAMTLSGARLAGLAAAAGFLAAVWLIGNFAFTPLTAARKLVVLAVAAAMLGTVLDLLQYRIRLATRLVLGALLGAGTVWVFWSVLVQKDVTFAIATGMAAAAFVAWLVQGTMALTQDPVRAGSASLALGLGSGIAALLGASALLAQYGIALGAACSAFLLWAVLRSPRVAAGATLTLTSAVTAGLLGVGAALLGSLSWTAVALFALVPVAARLPVPQGANVWVRALLTSSYACTAAALACGAAWWASRGAPA